ncbi:SWIM zinc finger family protein [Vulcanisaeta souniana]|uniref:SWIM zinc finger family protein n=1 Tax=Vulcanisaeta souniana TaxID=164452 RepID=UPI0006D0D40B|nr:SWIM zinc finger family protein [Vulcanisaeta souniana]
MVRSEADANKWYVARVLIEWTSLGGGEPAVRITGSCTCPAFQYRKPCKHITWLANKALAMARAGARAN